jgi:hypothetical protein
MRCLGGDLIGPEVTLLTHRVTVHDHEWFSVCLDKSLRDHETPEHGVAPWKSHQSPQAHSPRTSGVFMID